MVAASHDNVTIELEAAIPGWVLLIEIADLYFDSYLEMDLAVLEIAGLASFDIVVEPAKTMVTVVVDREFGLEIRKQDCLHFGYKMDFNFIISLGFIIGIIIHFRSFLDFHCYFDLNSFCD